MTSVSARGGKEGVSGKEKGEKIQEGGRSVRFEDEPRGPALQEPRAWGLSGFLCRGRHFLGGSIPKRPHLPSSGFETFLLGDGDSPNKKLKLALFGE